MSAGKDRAIEALRWAAAAIRDAQQFLEKQDDRLERAEQLVHAVTSELVTGAER